MAQVYLSKQQADNLATLIGYWLDSSYEADENDVPDDITQQHIELGIKAIEAGADIGSHIRMWLMLTAISLRRSAGKKCQW